MQSADRSIRFSSVGQLPVPSALNAYAFTLQAPASCERILIITQNFSLSRVFREKERGFFKNSFSNLNNLTIFFTKDYFIFYVSICFDRFNLIWYYWKIIYRNIIIIYRNSNFCWEIFTISFFFSNINLILKVLFVRHIKRIMWTVWFPS